MSTDNAPDVTADSLEQFAADLRELRRQAGNPTLGALHSRTHVSKSVLSEAFSGRKLPTERTVTSVAEALGADRLEWTARRNALDPRSGQSGHTTPSRPSTWRSPRISLLAAVLACALTAVIAVAATSVAWTTVLAPAPAEAGDEAPPVEATDKYLEHADGVDPMQTICREDAVIAASEERLEGDVLVQMMYSNQCMAVWGRITRYDGEAAGNSLSMLIYPAIDMESDRNQERSAFDVQSIYTPLLIEPDVEARVCGIATVSRAGEKIELGPPLCI